jgi:exopolysaccharide biosynthesis protein
MVKSGVHVD